MRARAVLLVAALLPLGAALLGSSSGRPVHLNFGPGDAPFVSGFAPAYEIDDKVATHWTTYRAVVRLPVRVEGGALARYRFARVFAQTARVVVRSGSRVVDAFEARGGLFVERAAPLPSGTGPIDLHLDVDSHERQDRGLKMDWLRVEPQAGARVRLAGTALATGTLIVLLVAATLLGGGWPMRHAAMGALLVAAPLSAGLLADPWLVHRLLRGVPLALAVLAALGLAIGRRLRARGRTTPATLRTLTALALATFLVRAGLVNHPDFYYPDLRTHARLVESVAERGWGFFAHPSRAIWDHGVWRTEAYGQTYAFPYSPAFHLPFVALGLPYDTRLTAMKLAAAGISVVPLVLAWVIARRWGIPPAGAFLMAAIPTYTSRLGFAFLPSLFGHAVDVAFLAWVSGGPHVTRRRGLVCAALWIAGGQLAYVSGVVNSGVLVVALAVLAVPLGRRPPREAASWLLALAAGGALAFILYYRDFLPMVGDVLGRALTGGARVSRYPVQPFLAVAYARTRDFFDGVYPLLALAGLAWMARRATAATGAEAVPRARWVGAAWLAAYFALLLGRARMPDLFLHGHETLLVTPLVCLAAGAALALAWRHSTAGRLLAVAAAAFLAVQGAMGQWRTIADQLGNAR